ncbi:hypothetical protein NEOLEDRAFT_1179989 [Neolentinus lepideus HHB14362 ss-1]|uniref:Uncharacterized protein n=1 Tax=Neolentinus lepideus HHB14362 ss-1 TaxID=1314782 RepID=A0A165RAP6_9AGAM|nr:hypothetical protein NEOLEDRAFT_1179989 [Neolentinus lepideus HHB14362 ss-1]
MASSLFFFVATLFALASLLSMVAAAPVEAQHLEARSKTYHGQGTWFNVGLGNCGEYNQDSDLIVALDTATYNSGSHCNKHITIVNTSNGKKAKAMVRDSCPSCGTGSIDMSPSLFEHFDSLDTGVISVEWWFD